MKNFFKRLFNLDLTGELLFFAVVNDSLVQVSRFPGVTLDGVRFKLNAQPVRLQGANVIAEKHGRYNGVTIVATQNRSSLVVVLSCPNKATPSEYCETYPEGAPRLSVLTRNTEVFADSSGLSPVNAAWPSFS